MDKEKNSEQGVKTRFYNATENTKKKQVENDTENKKIEKHSKEVVVDSDNDEYCTASEGNSDYIYDSEENVINTDDTKEKITTSFRTITKEEEMENKAIPLPTPQCSHVVKTQGPRIRDKSRPPRYSESQRMEMESPIRSDIQRVLHRVGLDINNNTLLQQNTESSDGSTTTRIPTELTINRIDRIDTINIETLNIDCKKQ